MKQWQHRFQKVVGGRSSWNWMSTHKFSIRARVAQPLYVMWVGKMKPILKISCCPLSISRSFGLIPKTQKKANHHCQNPGPTGYFVLSSTIVAQSQHYFKYGVSPTLFVSTLVWLSGTSPKMTYAGIISQRRFYKEVTSLVRFDLESLV